MPQGRILFIDAYDSFSNNITALLRQHLPVTVEVIKINDPRFVFNDDAFQDFLNKFDAVVAGPGPGHPADVEDVGLISKLWHLPDDRLLPVLGICLGFQSLALAFGASVERLCEPRHGLVTPITHCDRDIFAGVGDVRATQYHSLHVRLRNFDEKTGDLGDLWLPRRHCKEIQPLAWDLGDGKNGPILMGIRHCRKPFWGVQYHPESICSTQGQEMIINWWSQVCSWNAVRCPLPTESPQDSGRASLDFADLSHIPRPPCVVHWETVKLTDTADSARILETLRDSEECEPILLESGVRNGKPINPETGRFSIIGLHDEASLQVRWCANGAKLDIAQNGELVESRRASIVEVFDTLESITDQRKARDGCSDIPFWGGLVGFISYEAGLRTIDVEPAGADRARRPDVWFAMVERSVVIDHVERLAYIQTIRGDDEAWMSSTAERLRQLCVESCMRSEPQAKRDTNETEILSGPGRIDYCAKVSECQSHLRAGSSYELCLTDQTLVKSAAEPWALYSNLRQANPAPFGAYLRLQTEETGVSVISSSPERFLSWSRDDKCQFRPIKGTVKKTPGMTRAKAEGILASEKERAENLMIVDLIRHDLNGVTGYVVRLSR